MHAPKSIAVLLRTTGAVSRDDYRRARDAACAAGCTVLEGMVMLGLIDEHALADVLGETLCVPRASTQLLTNPHPRALEAIPPEAQVEWGALPLAIDRERYLHIAVRDPLLEQGLQELEFYAGRPLIRYLATPTEIAAALYVHHGAETPIYDRWLRDQLVRLPRAGSTRPARPAVSPARARREPRVLRLTPLPG